MSFLPETAAFKKHQSLPLGKLWIVLVSVTSSQNRWKIYSFEDSQSTTQTHMNQATNLKRKKQINKVDRSGVVKCLELHGSAWSAHFNLSTWHCMLLWDNLNMTHYRLRLHITTSQVLRFKPREYCLQGLGKLLMTLNYALWVLSYVGTTCSFSSKHALTNSLIQSVQLYYEVIRATTSSWRCSWGITIPPKKVVEHMQLLDLFKKVQL